MSGILFFIFASCHPLSYPVYQIQRHLYRPTRYMVTLYLLYLGHQKGHSMNSANSFYGISQSWSQKMLISKISIDSDFASYAWLPVLHWSKANLCCFFLSYFTVHLTIIHGMWWRMYVYMFLNHSRTPAPILTKIAPPIALDSLPRWLKGSGSRSFKVKGHLGVKSWNLQFNQFAGMFNRGHQRSFQGHHHISETPAPILTKLAPGVALAPPWL